MKQLLNSLIFLVVFNSCKEEKQLTFSEQYETEAYNLMNQAYLADYESYAKNNSYYDSILKSNNLPANRIFEKPYKNNKRRSFDFYLKKSPFYISDSLLKLNERNHLKSWSTNKLKNVMIIDTTKSTYLWNLAKGDYIYNEKIYDLWDKEVAGSFYEVSSPIFNEFLNMAIVFEYENSLDMCGTFKFNELVFMKENEKWVQKSYDFKNMEFKPEWD